jgi:hypothetical protein
MLIYRLGSKRRYEYSLSLVSEERYEEQNDHMGFLWLTLFIGCSFPAGGADNGQILIIGHKVVADSLKKEEVKAIFLGKKTRWADDTRIIFVLCSDQQVYNTFLKEYVRKTVFQ